MTLLRFSSPRFENFLNVVGLYFSGFWLFVFLTTFEIRTIAMLMKTPINRVRSAVPESCQETLDLRIGMCPLLRDQPRLAQSISNLAYSLVLYAEYLGPLKERPSAWVRHARLIRQELAKDSAACGYWEPENTLQYRQKAYPQLALLHVIQEGQRHLMIALGAEVMSALLSPRALHPGYCNNLRLDAQKVCVYEPVTAEQIEDLVMLGFGRKWKAGFQRRDAEVRKWWVMSR